MRPFLNANVLFTAAHNPNGKAAVTIELGGPFMDRPETTSGIVVQTVAAFLDSLTPGA